MNVFKKILILVYAVKGFTKNKSKNYKGAIEDFRFRPELY